MLCVVSCTFNQPHATENLLELKKQKLLLMLHKTPPPEDDDNAPKDKVKASVEAADAAVSAASLASKEDGIVGTKCRAPLKEVCEVFDGV